MPESPKIAELRIGGQADAEKVAQHTAESQRALGAFVLQFAIVEKKVLGVLFTISGVEWAAAGPLFSGIRLGSAMTYITKIAEAKGKKEFALLISAVERLKCIAQVRNDILHNGLQFWLDEDPRMVIRTMDEVPGIKREYPVSIKDLHKMTWDLAKIAHHFHVQFHPGPPSPPDDVLKITQASWRYNHSLKLRPTQGIRRGRNHR